MSKSLYEIGDMVRIQLDPNDDEEPNPHGFTGLISEKFFMPHEIGPFDQGAWIYTVQLPIAWQLGGPETRSHSWTFKETELLLLELAEGIQ